MSARRVVSRFLRARDNILYSYVWPPPRSARIWRRLRIAQLQLACKSTEKRLIVRPDVISGLAFAPRSDPSRHVARDHVERRSAFPFSRRAQSILATSLEYSFPVGRNGGDGETEGKIERKKEKPNGGGGAVGGGEVGKQRTRAVYRRRGRNETRSS